MDLPFGLIFSIFLIVVFIVIAFIAVKYFLNTGKCAEVGTFYRDLEEKVNVVWKSTETETSFKISLPSGITKICFANTTGRFYSNDILSYDAEDNLFLIPSSNACNLGNREIPHIDITKITAVKNPYCINNGESMRIKKEIYSKLVLIE